MSNQCLNDLFKTSFKREGEKIAISFLRNGRVETEISYFDLDRDATRLANTLLDWGIKKGDRVILFLPKSMFFIVAYLALLKIGGIAIPINPEYQKFEMSYLLNDADASLVLAGKAQKPLIEEIAYDIALKAINTDLPYQDIDLFQSAPENPPNIDLSPSDTGVILYTSGTTGDPKGAMLTHQNLVHDALKIINTWEISGSDVLCHTLPLFHIHGLCFALNTALVAGSKVVMFDAFSAEKVLDVLSGKKLEHRCTVFMAVPAMYERLLQTVQDKELDFKHMRLWTSGSAPLLPQDFTQIREVVGKEPVEREGMTETGMNFSNPIRGKRKPGSIGLPLPGLKVRIVDPETCVDVPQGGEGEIWLKGPGVSPGYWRKPDETAEAFKNGWFRTGDLGRMDEDGYYFLTDRIKHIIISGGENISPKEVEYVINQIPGVMESSVVGIPDKKWGEKVVAAVVKQPDSTIGAYEVEEACKQNLHKWKCPKEIIFVTELPRNTMGKILKEDLKKIFG